MSQAVNWPELVDPYAATPWRRFYEPARFGEGVPFFGTEERLFRRGALVFDSRAGESVKGIYISSPQEMDLLSAESEQSLHAWTSALYLDDILASPASRAISSLYVSGGPIFSLEALPVRTPQLRSLYLDSCQPLSTEPLAQLSELVALSLLFDCHVDLAFLSELQKLRHLAIQVEDQQQLASVALPELVSWQVPFECSESIVAAVVRAQPHLAYLDCWGATIRDLGCMSAAKTLTHLRLGGSVASLSPLRDLPNLQVLDAWDVPETCDISAITLLPHLVRLRLSQDLPQAAELVCGLRQAVAVRCRAPLGPAQLEQLVDGCPSLKHLGFACQSDTTVTCLSRLPELETLVVEELPTGASLKSLGACQQLRYLEINGSNASDTEWDLPQLAQLETFRCNVSRIEDAAWLRHLPNLLFLDLAYTTVADISAISAIPKLTACYLWNCEQLYDLTALAELENLMWLTCHNTALKNLWNGAKNTSLQWLDLSWTKIASVHRIESFPALRRLLLAHCDELKDIRGLRHVGIHELDLSACPQVEEYAVLPTMTALTRLTIADAQPHFTTTLLQGLPLWKLAIPETMWLTTLRIDDLPKLRILDVSVCTSLQAIVADVRSNKVRHLMMSYCEAFQDVDSVRAFGDVQSLDLSYTRVSSVEDLAVLTELRSLNLEANGQLKSISGLLHLPKLSVVTLADCDSLDDAQTIAELERRQVSVRR